ncbi:MAG: aconitase family protein, partial [Thermoprotei archaeon]
MLLDYRSPLQGIVHVVGPELGFILPGVTVACGDSHTSTNGALGALAFGVGTSEVEMVLATQTLWLRKPRTMLVEVKGSFSAGVTPKDVALKFIGLVGVGGCIGHAVEYAGPLVERLGVEERMTLTNLTTEAGGRTGIVSPDQKTFEFVKGKPFAPQGEEWDRAVNYWRSLKSDGDADYSKTVEIDVSGLEPQVTWGTDPSMVCGITEKIPDPEGFSDHQQRRKAEKALEYMGLKPGTRMEDVDVDAVFIGSCTNARLGDLVQAARVVVGKSVSPKVRAMVVPGSQLVKRRAEELGLHR